MEQYKMELNKDFSLFLNGWLIDTLEEKQKSLILPLLVENLDINMDNSDRDDNQGIIRGSNLDQLNQLRRKLAEESQESSDSAENPESANQSEATPEVPLQDMGDQETSNSILESPECSEHLKALKLLVNNFVPDVPTTTENMESLQRIGNTNWNLIIEQELLKKDNSDNNSNSGSDTSSSGLSTIVEEEECSDGRFFIESEAHVNANMDKSDNEHPPEFPEFSNE